MPTKKGDGMPTWAPDNRNFRGGPLARLRMRLYRVGARTLLRDRHGGTRLEGTGWEGFAVQSREATANALRVSVDETFAEVRTAIRAEFGETMAIPWVPFVVHVPRGILVDSVVRILLARADLPIDRVGGRYLPRASCAVVTGAPDSVDLCECAAHELCHAWSHLQFGATGRIPWSYEGYANIVADVVVRTFSRADMYQRHIDVFNALRDGGNDLSLRTVLTIPGWGKRMPPDYAAWFSSHATVFTGFLTECSKRSPGIAEARTRAIQEIPPSCTEQLTNLEQAFGTSIEEIETGFFEYCERRRSVE